MFTEVSRSITNPIISGSLILVVAIIINLIVKWMVKSIVTNVKFINVCNIAVNIFNKLYVAIIGERKAQDKLKQLLHQVYLATSHQRRLMKYLHQIRSV